MLTQNSILTSIKKLLGLPEEYDVFDTDITMHINSVFSTLNQLGVGPPDGFFIEDATEQWGMFLGDNQQINSVKTYVYIKVRLLFDPPTTSFAIDSLKKQADELEWRLNVHIESNKSLSIADSNLI